MVMKYKDRGTFVAKSPEAYSGTNLLVQEGLPSSPEGDIGQMDLRKTNGKYFLFVKVAVDDWRKVTQLTKVDGMGNTLNTIEGQEIDAADEVFNDVSVGNISGAPVWQSFPFILSSATFNRYYYIDVDDTANSYRRWDDYDTSPTSINYRDTPGQFVVPEDCKLVGMHGVIANNSSTNDPTIFIYYGTVTEAASDTTLTLAGTSTNVIVTTFRVPNKFSAAYNVNLSAGDIVVPMIRHTDSSGTRTFQGSLTLKFITR